MQINEESPVKRLAHGDSSARGTVVTKGLRLWRVCRVYTLEQKRPRVSPEMRVLSCLWVPPVSRALEAAVSSLVMPGGLQPQLVQGTRQTSHEARIGSQPVRFRSAQALSCHAPGLLSSQRLARKSIWFGVSCLCFSLPSPFNHMNILCEYIEYIHP